MTLQQLEYVVSLDKYRHFNQAAKACGITQSTLSTMIQKLELELDIVIFDRSTQPVKPTEAGQLLIDQARIVLYNASQIQELASNERQKDTGDVSLAISPTIAPYLVPKLFKYLNQNYPLLKVHGKELYRQQAVEQLRKAEIDMAIMAIPEQTDDIIEIPLYHEKMLAFVSRNCPQWGLSEIDLYQIPNSNYLWCLREETRLLPQVAELKYEMPSEMSRYESGNLATLIRIVQETGGMTIVPELYTVGLRKEIVEGLRPLINPVPVRDVCLYVRKDYLRERLVNIIVDGVKSFVPDEMLDSRLKKFAIRL